MQVIVTRPAQEAQDWVRRLRERAIDAVALPLIAVGGPPDPAALAQAWRGLAAHGAVMFVSGNAVREFFRARPDSCTFTPRAWAPGPGTRDALLAEGLDPASISAPAMDAEQFDSEALWAQVRGEVRPGASVLIVRGGEGERGTGREWLAGQLAQLGAQVHYVAAYTRGLPQWSEEQRELAERAVDQGAIWLFSSSEAIANLAALLPRHDFSRAGAVATHPRIAQAARDAGFGRVIDARPQFDAVIAALESAG
jgi:uroporphyrinogen-III synthase